MSNMSTSAIAQLVVLDLNPVVAISEKMAAINDVLSALEGFDDLYWGNKVEALNQLEILLLWCSPHSLKAFQSSMERSAVDDILQSMSTSFPTIYQLSFAPPGSLLCSSIVELLLLYNLPANIAPSTFDPMKSFIESTEGCLGLAAGSVAKDDERDDIGNAFLLIVGWESVEANEKGAKSEGFKKLPKVEGAKVLLDHVRFQRSES